MEKLHIVAVTGCISGVAHTYMAAEVIEKLAQQRGWSIKIETQGALGVENPLSEADILKADLVLLITNTNIKQMERFASQRCLQIDISQFLLEDRDTILKNIKKILHHPKGTHIKI